MSTLSDVLAAMDKATPEKWSVRQREKDGSGIYLRDSMRCIGKIYGDTGEQLRIREKVIAAAPDMAAWIEEALPYIEGIKEGMEAPLMVQPEKYDELCALLAEAKGEGI